MNGNTGPESGPTALRRIVGWYVTLIEIFAGVSMAVILVIMVAQVIARYAFGGSLIWAEELCRYILIWQTFLLLGLAYSRGEFVILDILPYMLAPRARLILKLVMAVPILIFLYITATTGYDYAGRFSRQVIPAMGFIGTSLTGEAWNVPIRWVYLSVAVGSVLLALHIIADMFGAIVSYRAGAADAARADKGEAV